MHQGLSIKPFDDWPPFEDGSLDAGLWCLAQVSLDGARFDLEEIAEVCDCSVEWVRKLEEEALRRLKLKLRHATRSLSDGELKELTTDILQSLDARSQDARTGLRTDVEGKTPIRGI